MRNMKLLSAGLVGAGFWLGAVAASADTVIVMDHSVSGAKSGDSNAGDATDKPMTMYLAGDRMSMALEKMGFIYRGDLNKVWVVQPEQHSYFEVTPASMGEMADRVNQMKAMMKSKLAGLPEAQRKQVEDMMAKNGLSQDASAPAPQISYEKAGDARKVGAWDCLPYKIVTQSKISSELCIANIADLGLSKDDLKAFVSFNAFMQKLRSAMGSLRQPGVSIDFDGLSKATGFDGFPVQTTTKLADGKTIVSTVKSIAHGDAPAGSYEVPAGFTKRDFAGMGHMLPPK